MLNINPCITQEECWLNTSNCSMDEYNKNSKRTCEKIASYCDKRIGLCKGTHISYPTKTPYVDWKTMKSYPKQKYERSCKKILNKKSQYSVVLVTLDGVRERDLFIGSDPKIVSMISDKKIQKKCIHRFGGTKKSQKKEINKVHRIAPFLHLKSLSPRRFISKKIKLQNNICVSYPGYSELLTGKVDPKITNNEFPQNTLMTFMEKAIKDKKITKKEVLMAATWNKMDDIYASKRSGIKSAISSFSKKYTHSKKPPLINTYPPIYEIDPDYVCPNTVNILPTSERHDIETYRAFLKSYFQKCKTGINPKAMHLALGLTDTCAHHNNYYEYLNHIHLADGIIRHLYYTVQPDFIVVAADHGRGKQKDWIHHKKSIDGSQYSWCIVLCNEKYKKMPSFIRKLIPQKLSDVSLLLDTIIRAKIH